jgi:uncharacterized protein (DUF2336 family)
MLSGEGKRQGVIRELLRGIVEQFVAREGRGQTELRQFERLAGDLIDVADSEIVATLAEALCRHPDTPPDLIRRFFDRGGDCARIAFEFAPEPPVADIIAKAAHGSAELAAAIARRAELPREAIGALAARDEGVVLYALAANRRIHLDTGALRVLMHVARDDQQLARLLLYREDIDVDPESLFLAATRDERTRIVLAACRSALVEGISDNWAPGDEHLAARLDALAAHEEHDAMISLVANALDARKSRVRKIFLDEGGEALALTYVALGFDLATATRLFLASGRAFALDADRVRALRALVSSTPRRAAARIVAAINGVGRFDREPIRRVAWREESSAQVSARRRGGVDRAAPSVRRLANTDKF